MVKSSQTRNFKGGATGRRQIRRKPKDKPKRPLSAYNYFFKSERQRILSILQRGPEELPPDDLASNQDVTRLRTASKKVSFEEMGKLIGKRWKEMTAEEMVNYKTLAAGDAERYKKELKVWNAKKEEEKKQAAAAAALYAKNNPNAYPAAQAQNGAYRYDPSMAAGGAYVGANRSAYPTNNADPNAQPSYGQPMGAGSYPYSSYPQVQKPEQATTSATQYNASAPAGNNTPSSEYNNYQNTYAGNGMTANPSTGVSYHNNAQAMPNVNAEYGGAQNTPGMQDPGSAKSPYYNQSQGQSYGSSFQSYPNNDPNQQQQQQRWG